jgi:heme/copper-type cytochrome/quinol oxidase subunit 3
MGLIFWILVRSTSLRDRPWITPLAGVGAGLLVVYVGVVIHQSIVVIVGVVIAVLGIALCALMYARSRGRVYTPQQLAAAGIGPAGDFGPDYFTPVDLVGLYWHLVDLIWIFLFPLLYLIH